jgi:hypothetical protein
MATFFLSSSLLLVILFLVFCIRNTSCDENNTAPVHQHYETHYEIEIKKSGLDFSSMLEDLGNLNAQEAASVVIDKLTETIHSRMTAMFQKAITAECRAKIGLHFSYWINAIGNESAGFPFVGSKFYNSCPEPPVDFNNLPSGATFESLMNRTYQPPRNEAEYIRDKRELKILYGILMHGDDARGTIRLIEALYDDGHTFVVHVDGKEISDKAYDSLVLYSQNKTHVHLVPREYCVRVNWGGYSMVNATMQILKYSFGLLDHLTTGKEPLEFHKFVHISGSSYPLKSNTEIRDRISSYPLDANMLLAVMKPLEPDPSVFNYYVECDDAVHRIYRMPTLSASTHGANVYTSSQWFIISRDFAMYLAKAEPGTFVHDYMQYAEHVVVADETFFGTVLRNSEYCTKHHNDNFLHLQFDRWESDIENGQRDARKCLSPDPNRCGRSPTILTVDDFFTLELSNKLFARKFSDNEVDILDLIDEYRAADELKFRDMEAGNFTQPVVTIDTRLEGQGTLIVAKDSVNTSTPLCLGLGMSGYHVSTCYSYSSWY